jgi:hypothetical protein
MHPGFFRLTTNNLTHDLRLDLGGSPAPFTYTDTIMDFQGGDLTVGLSVRVTGGIATVQKTGTVITVAHLGRR